MCFSILLFVFFVFLFFREEWMDQKRFIAQDRLGDEHILREVERFLKEMEHRHHDLTTEVNT